MRAFVAAKGIIDSFFYFSIKNFQLQRIYLTELQDVSCN